jgi:hypothetical protein
VKGTQEGFLSRAISPPHPKGISSPLTRLRHSDKFRPLAEICPRHIQKPYGFWICRGLMMMTYPELIQIGILIVGIIGLFMNANKKK